MEGIDVNEDEDSASSVLPTRDRALSVDEGSTLRNTPVPAPPTLSRRTSCPDIYDWQKVLEDIRTESPIEPKGYELAITASGQIPLENDWSFWFDVGSPKGVSKENYEDTVKLIGTFQHVQDFWRYWHSIQEALKDKRHYNLRLFKSHIRPLWEDKCNVNGGKFVIFLKDHELSQKYWSECVLACIGEQIPYGDCISGVVYSVRPNDKYSISIWISSSEGEEVSNIKEGFCSMLEIEDRDVFVFTKHRESFKQSIKAAKKGTEEGDTSKKRKRTRKRTRRKKKKGNAQNQWENKDHEDKIDEAHSKSNSDSSSNASPTRGNGSPKKSDAIPKRRANEMEQDATIEEINRMARSDVTFGTKLEIEDSKPVPLPETVDIPDTHSYEKLTTGMPQFGQKGAQNVKFSDYYGREGYVPPFTQISAAGPENNLEIYKQDSRFVGQGYPVFNPVPGRVIPFNPGIDMYTMQDENYLGRSGFQFNTASYFTAEAQTELSAQNTDATSDGTEDDDRGDLKVSKKRGKRKKRAEKMRKLKQRDMRIWFATILFVFFAGIAIDAFIRFLI